MKGSAFYYFSLTYNSFRLVNLLLLSKQLWLNQDNWLGFVNAAYSANTKLTCDGANPSRGHIILSRMLGPFLCILYISIAFSVFIWDFVMNAGPHVQNAMWYSKLVVAARFTFFLGNRTEVVMSWDEVSELDIFLSVVTTIVYFAGYIALYFFVELTIPLLVLTNWFAVSLFIQDLEEGSSDKILVRWPEVVNNFEGIRNLLDETRVGFGLLMVVFTGLSILRITMDLNDIVDTMEDSVYLICCVILDIVSVAVIILAADCNAQVY